MYMHVDGRIVSAGAGNKISVWRSGRERSEDWSLHRWFDTEEAGNIHMPNIYPLNAYPFNPYPLIDLNLYPCNSYPFNPYPLNPYFFYSYLLIPLTHID
jgi:hypothetical protein